MQPDEILELIRSAPQRYDSVRAALPGRRPKHKETRELMVRTEAGRRAFDIPPREARKWMENPVYAPEPNGPYGWRCRAWYAGRYRKRLETEVPGGRIAISAVGATRASGDATLVRDRAKRIRGGST